MRSLNLFGHTVIVDDGTRDPWDFYPTPPFMTRSLLLHHPWIAGRPVLECCSGDDAITAVLRDVGCTVSTNDLDPRQPAETHLDATTPEYWGSAPAVDWVITNPPFDTALPILQHAVCHARLGVAFLLRKTFLEPTDDRGPWLQANPPQRCVGQPRYSFRGKGTDSVSCDWMIWCDAAIWPSVPPFIIDYDADRRPRLPASQRVLE